MPFVEIPQARLWYDEAGRGDPLVCLHSGWGRGVMPFDDAADLLAAHYRMLFPDRRATADPRRSPRFPRATTTTR